MKKRGDVYGVLFVSSYREMTRESYDESPEKVYSRFDFTKARGAPVRVYIDSSRIKKITAFDLKNIFIYIYYIYIYVRYTGVCVPKNTTKHDMCKGLTTES